MNLVKTLDEELKIRDGDDHDFYDQFNRIDEIKYAVVAYKNNISAIVEALYPGQDGGTTIADVLFGDYNPAGRLPVTFYKSIDQLPPFVNYDMEGRTYRFFRDEPSYPFGYGLSY